MPDFGHTVQEWWPLVVNVFIDVLVLGTVIARDLWRIFQSWA